MRPFPCLLSALTLVFIPAGSIQSQTTATDAATKQTVASAQTVAYCDLVAHSEKFKNQTIRVQAIYETDFEKSVITSPLCQTPLPMTWVTFDGHWESRTTRSVRKTVSEAKWRVPLDVVFVGKFKTDGRYGHMDMYPLSIEVYEVEAAATSKNAEQSSETGTDAELVLFDWSATPDQIVSWLKKNERLLNRGDGCTLTVHWSSAEPKPGDSSSSVHEIASMILAPSDEENHLIIRDKVSGSGLEVRVGVLYLKGESDSKVWGLRIALASDGPPQDVFSELSRAEAATLRDEQWRMLTVVKPIRVSGMVYTYSFSCENGKTFLSFLRRPPKTRAPTVAKPQ